MDSRLLSKIEVLKGDAVIVDSILDQESPRLFERIMLVMDENMAAISPRLLFEVLMRMAAVDLKNRTYTIERTSSQRIPVFDAHEVFLFLRDASIRKYLVDLLCSFTKVQSFTVRSRVRKGVWRRIRFSDMDVVSLIRLCEAVDEEHRFSFYKRIGDLCLFILGMFPEHVGVGSIHPVDSRVRVQYNRRFVRSSEDYEEEGKLFYQLAAQHHDARKLDLNDVLLKLQDKFALAKKPLNYISENYLKFAKGKIFTRFPN